MRRVGLLLSIFMAVGVCALFVTTDVRAELVPCCEGGYKPDKRCSTDDECPDVCVGGFRDGRPCDSSPCLDACVGGHDDGKNCGDGDESKCRDACVGGSKHGSMCTSNAQCPGGSCSNIGTCSNNGTCTVGTCTGLCQKKGPKSPSEPVMEWLGLPSALDTAGDYSPRPCP